MASSPLPDSTALEAGILEDPRPSRLSRVQDNVRNLLRTSVFGSVAPSPTSPTQQGHSIPRPPTPQDHLRSQPTLNPLRSHPPTPVLQQFHSRPEVLPSPTDSTTSTHYSERSGDGVRCPPGSYYQNIQRMAHQSALFNSRAVAALNHPDLSDPSLTDLSQQKSSHRHERGWTRSRNGTSSHVSHKKRNHVVKMAAGSQGLLLTLASFLLAALVATYVSLTTTVEGVTTTFHVLFILGILLATIVFSHALIRFFLATKRRSRNLPTFVRVTRHGQQRHHRHHHHHHGRRHQHSRQMPTLTGEAEQAFVPPTPIQVQVAGEEVRADASMVQPTATVERTQDWDKVVQGIPNPPPAYGRWRGSVRADPNLLHWQAVSAPALPGTPTVPSPTYEEAMAAVLDGEAGGASHPPSYMTRDSPARQRGGQEARAGLVQSQVVEPEMFEVRPVIASAPTAGDNLTGPGVGLAM